jgi:beta-N-acetylhexosaminidase
VTDLERLALAVQMSGFSGPHLPGAYADLLARGLGGICLFGSNTAGGPAQVRRLVDDIHRAGPGSVVAVDEEGGDVTRLHAMTGSPVLGAAALGAADDLALTESTGRAVGGELAAYGIDLCLGPVADLNTNVDNPVIGTRSFGTDPHRAAEHVAVWVRGLQTAGPTACAKHFPGHGDTADDSHLSLPVVTVDADTLAARELVPFAAAVAAGCRAVMTSHIVVPAIDPERPATFSPAVLALLRERLGFDGVVVTDALDMAGASGSTRSIPEAAVLALQAGVDLLCLGPDIDPGLVEQVQAAIMAAVGAGRLPEERLRDAATRAATARMTTATIADAATDQAAGARAALRVEGRLPDLTGARLVRIESVPSIAVGPVPWGLPTDLSVDPADPAAADRLLDLGRPLVLQVRDAHRSAPTGALLDKVTSATALVVEWGWPGPANPTAPRICTHGISRPAYAAVFEVLASAGWAP